MDIDYVITKEMLRRKYSPKTIKSYLYYIHKLFEKVEKEPSKISKTEIKEYLNNINTEKISGNTMNVNLNALKFFFEEILHKNMRLNIRYSKVPRTLPVVLTKEEIKKLFENIENKKHKLMVQFMYSAGLRVSELLNLKVKDLELDKNYGFVRHGKGNKDRIFILSEILKEPILELIKKEKIDYENNLFQSNRNNPYNSRSLQEIIKTAAKKAKINKKVHPHTLRHSFATHLIENGYSIVEVQSLLGHKSPETTFVYVHANSPKLIKVKSPLDNL